MMGKDQKSPEAEDQSLETEASAAAEDSVHSEIDKVKEEPEELVEEDAVEASDASDNLQALQEKLEAAQLQVADLKEQALRSQAEAQNVRRSPERRGRRQQRTPHRSCASRRARPNAASAEPHLRVARWLQPSWREPR